MRSLLGVFGLFLILLPMASCGQSDRPSPSSTEAVTSAVPDPIQVCAPQIEAWKVKLADYRATESNRQTTCQSLGDRQQAVNSSYRQIKSQWPFTGQQLEDCAGRTSDQDRRSCVQGLCVMLALGGYDCGEFTRQVVDLLEQQQSIYADQDRSCCPGGSQSEIATAFALRRADQQCTPPPEPPAPTCAGTAAGNTM